MLLPGQGHPGQHLWAQAGQDNAEMGPGIHQHLVGGRVPPGHCHHSPQDLQDRVIVTGRAGERGHRGAQSLWGPLTSRGEGAGVGRGDRGVPGISNTDRARVRGQWDPGTLSPAGQGRGDRGILEVPVPAGWWAGSSAGSPPGAAAGLGTSGSAWPCDCGAGGDTKDPWGAGGTGAVSQSVLAEDPAHWGSVPERPSRAPIPRRPQGWLGAQRPAGWTLPTAPQGRGHSLVRDSSC